MPAASLFNPLHCDSYHMAQDCWARSRGSFSQSSSAHGWPFQDRRDARWRCQDSSRHKMAISSSSASCFCTHRNAFNEIGQLSVYETLPHASPLLAGTQFSWLCRPTLVILDNHAARNGCFVTTTGIPQGGLFCSCFILHADQNCTKSTACCHPNIQTISFS